MLDLLPQPDIAAQKNSTKWLTWSLVSILIFVSVWLRLAGLRFLSGDMDVFLLPWYNRLVTGGFAALREPFSNYTPPYLYLLFLVTKTAGFLPKVVGIKLLSILFDYLNAFLIYKILKIKFPRSGVPWIGASVFLLLPTMVLNSAYWGQCDSIYAFFWLACLFFLMKDQPLMAVIFLGVSFAIKAQAFFIAPLITLLILKKKIPWFYLGIVALVYILLMVPAALTGRSLTQLLMIYANQEETYSALSLHAPNLYLLFPANMHNHAIVLLGIVSTIVVVLAWIFVYIDKVQEFSPESFILFAMMSVALMPFFLPKMHERYFYLADMISLLMAFYFSRGWLLALGYQLTSGLSYSVYLLWEIMRVDHAFAGNLLISALFVNVALMGFIFSYPWKLTNEYYKKE